MDKEYNAYTRLVPRRPRSPRLREAGLGGTVSSGVSVSVSGGTDTGAGAGHSHLNLADLDRITTDDDGYIWLTWLKSIQEGGAEYIDRIVQKVRAGLADLATLAEDLTPDSPVYSRVLSRLTDDTAQGLIGFLAGLRVGNYVAGTAGAAIDAQGNAEVESLTARSYLKVYELIYNRLNALEGNTSFADVGTIEAVEGDRLTMRRRWEGDFTAFQEGDIVYGYVNKLDSSGEYYKAWGWVRSVDREANALTIQTYSHAAVPSGINRPFTPGMIVTRWGNVSDETRQDSFYVSSEDSNIVQLMGVSSPILHPSNYGSVLGKIPQGLLDRETERLLNSRQPYIFARGAIIQDLIRIDYNGNPVRSANYRGAWSAATAASDPYRSDVGNYDTVTHEGSMWQCLVSNTQEEPSDTASDWHNMAGGRVTRWEIYPSGNYIAVHGEDRDPSDLTVRVSAFTTHGERVYTDAYALYEQGVRLWYSIDDGEEQPYIFGTDEPLTWDDLTVLETEEGEPLTTGGCDIDTTAVSGRVRYILRDIATDGILAVADVPVISDGAKGERGERGEKGEQGEPGTPGRNGLMVYPDGMFDATKEYKATGETCPVVKYLSYYYVLLPGKTYFAPDMPPLRRNPASDYAYGGDDRRWERFDSFNAIFADIVMADFAKLGSGVFFGDWMISQQGTVDGEASTAYQGFRDDTFKPNLALNFATGELTANTGVFAGSVNTRLKTLGYTDATHGTVTTPRGTFNNAYLLRSDMNIMVENAGQVIVLPTDRKYIGYRVMIVDPVGSGSKYITAQNGTGIRGIRNMNPILQIEGGVLELLCFSSVHNSTVDPQVDGDNGVRWCVLYNNTFNSSGLTTIS